MEDGDQKGNKERMQLLIDIVVFLFGALCPIFCFIVSIRLKKRIKQEGNIEAELRAKGVILEGTVVGHHPPSLFVARTLLYRYQYQGKSYQKKQVVSRKDFLRFRDGAAIRVHSLSDDPEQATLIDCRDLALQQRMSFAGTSTSIAVVCALATLYGMITTILHMLH
jgi:hypothetical protein